MMPSYPDLIEITMRALALAEEAADQRAMPDPEADKRLRQAKEDLDKLLSVMEG